jgi:hypothetical protein
MLQRMYHLAALKMALADHNARCNLNTTIGITTLMIIG